MTATTFRPASLAILYLTHLTPTTPTTAPCRATARPVLRAADFAFLQ